MHAPCKDVDELYSRTKLDTFKVMGGMITELDYGVGNITRALEAAGRPYVLAMSSDNGGPLPAGHGNAPLRGGKHTLWDGGLRVRSWASGSLIPKAQRGKEWAGLAHSSDWYRTWIEGVAGLAVPETTGPRAPDGFNVWAALTAGHDSPRSEVVHQVENNYTKAFGLHDPPAIRVGKYKLNLGDPGGGPSADIVVPGPEQSAEPVPFGGSGGSRGYDWESDFGHCRAPALPQLQLGASAVRRCIDGCLFDLEADEAEETNLIGKTS